MVLKIQKADAAADDAREQIDYKMFRFIHFSLADLERLPGLKAMCVGRLRRMLIDGLGNRSYRLLERGAMLM